MKVHGIELIDDGDMVIKHQTDSGKGFESESVMAWVQACSHGGTAIDAGAYTGLYSILAAQLGMQVHAFEPNPAVYQRLLENVLGNQVIASCYFSALSHSTGELGFVGKSSTRLTSAGRVKTGTGTRCVAIDDLRFTNVRAIKIDTEGHERCVIKGALNTISRDKPLIITEALDSESRDQQGELLLPLGYTPLAADSRNIIWQQ